MTRETSRDDPEGGEHFEVLSYAVGVLQMGIFKQANGGRMRNINQIMPVTKVQRKLLDILDVMQEDDSTITMTKNGVAVGVLMTVHHYEALQETIEIMADANVLSTLAESARDFEAGRFFSDSEVWSDQ